MTPSGPGCAPPSLPDDFATQAAAAGFGDHAAALAGLALPAIELRLGDDGAGPAVGQLGGLPALPAGTAWPRSERGEPLTFFGTFDLAALPAGAWPGPASGTLQLFALMHEDAAYVDGIATVLHHGAGTALEPAAAPGDLAPGLQLTAAAVHAHPVVTLPWVEAAALEAIGLSFPFDDPDPERFERYAGLANAVAGQGPWWGRVHQLGGWPKFAQDDVAHLWPDAEDGPDRPEDWRLLAQLDGDPRLGARFGDGGCLHFGIPAADLAAGRFDRVQAFSDSA